MKPLDGVTVIDLTRILSGPYATMIMADFGATVIKIERPGTGDDSRSYGPYVKNESAYFMSVNRGKKSVTVDLQKQEGKTLFKKMAGKADVVIENFRPGTMEKLNLGYEVLKKENNRLIYVSVSGFGQEGPYALKPAYDIIIQAMSGIISVTGPDGGPPSRVGTSIGDIVPGMFAVIGTMMALLHRHTSGLGQKLDISMFDGLIAVLENAIARYQVNGEIPKPIGNRHPSITPFDSFSVKDGEIIVVAGSEKLWEKLCRVIGKPEILSDPRFMDYQERHKNHKILKEILNEYFSRWNISEALEILEGEGIPCSSINSVDRLFNDPHVRAREMLIDIEHPIAGIMKFAGIPIKMDITPGSVQAPAPLLGQHTEEVLKKFVGLSADEIESLRKDQVI